MRLLNSLSGCSLTAGVTHVLKPIFDNGTNSSLGVDNILVDHFFRLLLDGLGVSSIREHRPEREDVRGWQLVIVPSLFILSENMLDHIVLGELFDRSCELVKTADPIEH